MGSVIDFDFIGPQRWHEIPMARATSASVTSPPASDWWILGARSDLLLFVGTPALIVPLFYLARQQWQARELATIFIALGGVGHHLPGMMRAYGDRALFARFKVRFIVAPIFLVAVCAWCAWKQITGLNFIVLCWATWHLLAQTYGFLRIYDAKVGSMSRWSSRLDRAMCIVWFVAASLLSAPRMADILSAYYVAGGPPLAGGVVHWLRGTWAIVTALVTIAYVGHAILLWRRGQPQNPIKYLLFVVTVAFWWFCMSSFSEVIIGLALFEIFHDVQYLAIVWVFNRNRAAKHPEVGTFTRFLFRQRYALVGLYVGLVLAYGALVSFPPETIGIESVKRLVIGALLASTLLHYYFDGFIWRVREESTRESLGVASTAQGGAVSAPRNYWPGWLIHLAYWSLFIGPLAFLGAVQVSTPQDDPDRRRSELEWRHRVVAAVPDSAAAHHQLGLLLLESGNARDASRYLQHSLQLDPRLADSYAKLGHLSLRAGEFQEAEQFLWRAISLEPRDAEVETHLGIVYFRQRRLREAQGRFERAIVLDEDHAPAHYNLGMVHVLQNAPDLAERSFRRTLDIDSKHVQAHNNLGGLYGRQGKLDQAVKHFSAAVSIDPENAEARTNLRRATSLLERQSTSSAR